MRFFSGPPSGFADLRTRTNTRPQIASGCYRDLCPSVKVRCSHHASFESLVFGVPTYFRGTRQYHHFRRGRPKELCYMND